MLAIYRIFGISLFIIFIVSSLSLVAQPIINQDFESGIGNWWVDNGLWEVGIPTVGPQSTHSGVRCAGTVLSGNYTSNANTRLISPQIILPALSSGEYIKLKFWYWFRLDEDSFYGYDQGFVQISVNGGDWQTLAGPISGWSTAWTQGYVDLSAYADSTVRIAFNFTSSGAHEENGWYIDDISITVGAPVFNNPEDFEIGTGDWSTDNGLWEVGIPTVGPDSGHSGQNCVGTILGGNYYKDANTRLISPQIILPALSSGEYIKLKFWYWFRLDEDSFYGYDQGFVQISVNGGDWQTLAGPISGWSTAWTQGYVDLSAYADSTVRIAFNFTSSGAHEENGWYIDDISITVGAPVFNNPEDFEIGIGDWSADNGLWEAGIPTVGPDSAHSGQNCVGTILGGNYYKDSNTRLISPQIPLNPVQGNFVELYYWHWFRLDEDSFYGYDQGYVEISVNGGSWQTLAGPISGLSTVWTQGYVDLSAYADSTVRIAFNFTSSGAHEDNGWYIDDVRIEGIPPQGIEEYQNIHPHRYTLSQNYPNPFNPATNIQFGLPKASHVKIEVFNILGQKVATLLDERKSAGYHAVEFDGSNLSSGVYFYKIQADAFSRVRKMLLIK